MASKKKKKKKDVTHRIKKGQLSQKIKIGIFEFVYQNILEALNCQINFKSKVDLTDITTFF